MKFNEVTWYSKLLALILFVALPFIGFYLGVSYQKAISVPTTNVVNNSKDGGDTKTIVDTDQITVKTQYKNGTLKYSGTVQLPSPCYNLRDETAVLESFPEQVQIRLVITELETKTPGNIGLCAQVITEKEFSGEVKVSKEAVVSVFLDGEKVN